MPAISKWTRELGIEGQLGDDVGSQVRSVRRRCVRVVELRTGETQRGSAEGSVIAGAAAGTADVLVRVLKRQAERHLVARVIEHADARLAGPGQADM